MNSTEKKLLLIYLIIDLFLINFSVSIIYYYKFYFLHYKVFEQVLFSFNLSWLLALSMYRRKNLFLRNGFLNRVARSTTRFMIFTVIFAFIIFIIGHDDIPRAFLTLSSFVFLSLNLLFYYLVYTLLGIFRRYGHYMTKVLIIGAGRSGQDVGHFIDVNLEMGYSVVGYLDDNLELKDKVSVLGGIDELSELYNRFMFNEIIITLPLIYEEKISEILAVAEYNGIRVRLIPDFYRLVKHTYSIETKDAIPFLNVHQIPLDNFNFQICKRVFDILFSSVVLLCLSPILVLLALSIWIESRGPVFYKPVRLGKGGKEFTIYKFRSMSVCDVAVGGANSTKKNDDRITSVGRIIRKYSLDELPQFLNVFLGDMSVVGPRPHRVWLNKDLQSKVQGYMMRHYVKPGITGWAQVNGWRGPTETRQQRYGRTLHDLWYIENWSFLLDLWIIFLTVFGVKTRKNAF